jgi:hypothetical protein
VKSETHFSRAELKRMIGGGNDIYIFHRKEGWYPILLADDEDARRNAERNIGTTLVERFDGTVVWRAQ